MNRENDLDNKKFERISKILRESEVIPPAPDCRKAVMNRISGRKKIHPVRVYAFGLAVVAIIAVLGGLRMWNAECGVRNEGKVATRPYHSDKKDVNKLKIVPLPDYKKIAESTLPPSSGKAEASKLPLPSREKNTPWSSWSTAGVREKAPSAPRHLKHNRTLPLLAKTEDQSYEEPALTSVQHIQVQGSPKDQIDKRPVALVVVSWPSSGSNPQGDCNYSYTKRDTENETTTECKVKRSGDHIEIHMESKPEDKKPPVKGSVDNETNPSA